MAKQWPFDGNATQTYTRVRQEFIARFLKDVGAQVSLKTALDVGCGVGYFSRFLADLGFEVVALDGRDENVKEGQRRHAEIRFFTRNVEDPSLSEFGAFDLVLCVGLLYHLENPFQAIRNLHALTGKILLVESMCMPGDHADMSLLDECQGEDQSFESVAFYPTEACLVKMLRRAGFPFVYRFRQLPPDEQFAGTLLRKRSRTFLTASKLQLSSSNLEPTCEPIRLSVGGFSPWSTRLSRSWTFSIAKISSMRHRFVRIFVGSGADDVPRPDARDSASSPK